MTKRASIQKKISKTTGKPVYYVVFRDSQTGKQIWHKAADKKSDAEFEKAKILLELDQGVHISASKITVKEFMQEWLEAKKADVRPRTFHPYRGYTNNEIVPFFGNRKLKSIRPQDIEAFKAYLHEKGKTPANIAKYLMVLKMALKTACIWGYIGRNPAEFVKKPRAVKFEPMFLTPDQLKKLVDTTPDKHKAIIATACFSGLRQSELLGLKWDDVDFSNKKLYIKRTLQWGEFLDTKTASSRRGVDIPGFTVNLLKEHQLRQLVDLPGNEYGLVFTNSLGKPLEARTLTRYIFEPTLKLAELSPIRFHDLRHSYASMLIGQGANIKYVQKQLGHSTVQMTLNTYSHLLPDAGSEAIEKLDNFIQTDVREFSNNFLTN